MRRPLKPFVTEYKSTPRRQLAGSGDQMTSEQVPERPVGKAFEPRMRPPEDSYEAAMRAADALFAAPSVQPKAHTPEDVWDRRPAEQPNSPTRWIDDDAHGDGAARVADAAPAKSGGRILRVIDEEPSPHYAALEIERAPKRRGRKPGSKNKPKVRALMAEAATSAPRANGSAEPAPGAGIVSAQRDLARRGDYVPANPASDLTASSGATSIPSVPAVQQIAALQTPTAPRENKRATWGRDRPRPGEEWKRRRLPRVCW